MNMDVNSKRYVVWDNHNELPLITVMSKSTRKYFGLFLMTSGPAEILTFPTQDRLVYRILGDNIFTLYLYAGPNLQDVTR